MTRLQRLSPVLLGALMAACSEAQPYLQPLAPVAAQAVVVDAGLGDRTAKLDLRAAAAYALQQATTVHRWVPADLVRYDVELRVRNATTATQYDAVGQGLTAQVPVNGQGAGSATFNKLRQGSYYRAYVKAMGKAGGASAQGTEVAMNAQAQNDHVDFDFTAANDVAQEVSRTVTVNFDGVAFSGTGAIAFGTPSPGAFVAPSDAPAVAVSNPPSATPRPLQQFVSSHLVGPNAFGVAIDSAGNPWVPSFSANAVSKLSSSGSLLVSVDAANPYDVAVNTQGELWVSLHRLNQVLRFSSAGSFLSSAVVGLAPTGITFDRQGNAWVLNSSGTTPGGSSLTKLSSSGAFLATLQFASPPLSVAFGAQNQMWVLFNNRLDRLDGSGNVLSTHAVGSTPESLTVDAQDNLWVVNSGREFTNEDSLMKLSSLGNLVATFTATQLGARALAVDSEGRLWVAHGGLGRGLMVFSSTGSVLATHNTGNTQDLAIAPDGSVWVTNSSGVVSLYR